MSGSWLLFAGALCSGISIGVTGTLLVSVWSRPERWRR